VALLVPFVMYASLLPGCADEPGPVVERGDADTAGGPRAAFTPAVLDPPFGHANGIWAGVALLDYDNDGWLDIFFANGLSHPDALYRNLGDGRFEDVAAAAGVASMAQHGGVAAGDIDNDGDADLVVTTECSLGTLDDEGRGLADGGVEVLRNQGDGTFVREPVTLPPHPTPAGTCPVGVELYDLDGDGFLDLVVNGGLDPDQTFPWVFRKHVAEAVDRMVRNDGAGHFVESYEWETTYEESNDELIYEHVTFTSLWVDLDGDGRHDRLVGSAGSPIELQRGHPIEGLVPEYDGVPQLDGLWMGFAAADFDADGDVDVYATNQGLSPFVAGYDNVPEPFEDWVDPESYARELMHPGHALLRNDDGVMVPVNAPLEAEHLLAGDLFDASPFAADYPHWGAPEGLLRLPWAWAAQPIDLDADGWMDVVFASNNGSPPLDIIWDEAHGAGPGGALRNLQGEGFADVTWELGVANVDAQGRYVDARAVAVGDLDNDGYADIVFGNRSYNTSESDPLAQEVGRPLVLLSGPREGHWLQIDLEGTTSNRDAVGALVMVDDGQHVRAVPYGAGGATASSSEDMLSLGLGAAERVDLRIRFPSGTIVELDGVTADQRIHVVEP
jgi:hypothetical protein